MTLFFGTPVLASSAASRKKREVKEHYFNHGRVTTQDHELLYRSSAVDAIHHDENGWTPSTFRSSRTDKLQAKNDIYAYMDTEDLKSYNRRVRLVPISQTRRGKSIADHVLSTTPSTQSTHTFPYSLAAQSQSSDPGLKNSLFGRFRADSDRKGVDHGFTPAPVGVAKRHIDDTPAQPLIAPTAKKIKKRRTKMKISISASTDYYEDDDAGRPSIPSPSKPTKIRQIKTNTNPVPQFVKIKRPETQLQDLPSAIQELVYDGFVRDHSAPITAAYTLKCTSLRVSLPRSTPAAIETPPEQKGEKPRSSPADEKPPPLTFNREKSESPKLSAAALQFLSSLELPNRDPTVSFPTIPQVPMASATKALRITESTRKHAGTENMFGGDGIKRHRYLTFLRYSAGMVRDYYMNQAVLDSVQGMTHDQIKAELDEFVALATSSGDGNLDIGRLESREGSRDRDARKIPKKAIVFTSSSAGRDESSDTPVPQSELAHRVVSKWTPDPVLCKRFGVPVLHPHSDESPSGSSSTTESNGKHLPQQVNNQRSNKSKDRSRSRRQDKENVLLSSLPPPPKDAKGTTAIGIDLYFNAALNLPRAAKWLYEAIFNPMK